MTNHISSPGAQDDLAFIRNVIARTDRRVDPHAFHYVHWGAIVLVWYPLSNAFAQQDRRDWVLYIGLAALALGMALSTVREIRLKKNPRLAGENTFVSQQLMLITFACIGAGIVLSAVSPNFTFIEGPQIPTLWGLVYANMAVMIGIVYRRAFLYAGLLIFAGAIAAIVLPDYNGLILGPLMGLGLIIPGVQAERRVRRLRAEEGDA